MKSEYSHQTEIQYSILPESLPTHESQLPYLKIIEDNDIGKLPEDQVFEVAYLIQKTLEAKQLKSEDLEKVNISNLASVHLIREL